MKSDSRFVVLNGLFVAFTMDLILSNYILETRAQVSHWFSLQALTLVLLF